MTAIATHLDDLVAVLRASAGLRPAADTAAALRTQLAARLARGRPDLAAQVRALDDFVTDAHAVAAALEVPPARGDAETRVG